VVAKPRDAALAKWGFEKRANFGRPPNRAAQIPAAVLPIIEVLQPTLDYGNGGTDMNQIRVGDRIIGTGHPAFLVAEIGINHNGDLDLAKRAIDAAVDSGADAVKFQNYRTDDFIRDRSLLYEYVSSGSAVVESQYDMFKRCELSRSDLASLKQHSDARRIIFFSTPSGEDGIKDLLDCGVRLLKNGSDYLVHLPLIKAMGRTGLPTVISTGMATLAEIDDAVRAFRDGGGEDLILLHCTSSYPTPPEATNLKRIPTLAAAFGCPVGFSDHTWGIVAAVGAVALGACFVEKHFTLNKNLPGPDHAFSADPEEFHSLVTAVRALEQSMGDPFIELTTAESSGRKNYRLSCIASRDLPAGHCLQESDIIFARPGTGEPPKAMAWLVGRCLIKAVASGHIFKREDLS
jgi:N,N'-diacetyllegionaminate synthase